MRVGTNLVSCDGRKRAIQTCEKPLPSSQKTAANRMKSDLRFIHSVTWPDGQHNSTEKAKSGGRYIFYVRKDFQFELHSARKL